MPYADPEVRKQKDKEYKSRPDVLERNRERYRKQYQENQSGIADKSRSKHYKQWQNPEYRAKKKEEYIKRWERDWAGQTLIQIKAKAKKAGKEFNLTREDLILPEKCPIFGIPLIKNKDTQANNSASVDRIDNSKGYVKGNVVVVSLKANSIKREATIDELRKIVSFYETLTKGLTQND